MRRSAVVAVCLCVFAVGGSAAQPMPSEHFLAFISDADGAQDLYVTDVTRSTTTRLTNGLGGVESPVWSPDGAQLAFTATAGRASSIFVVNRDGSGLRRLAAGRSPSWAPDGARMAFSAIENDNEDIVVVGLDAAARRQRVTTHPTRDFTPRWAPDGAHVAFASARGESSRFQGGDYGSEIYLMNADGSGVRALTANNACGLRHESEGKFNDLGQAAWTRDGRRLLYRAGVCKFDCRVCVIDLTENRVYPLVNERLAGFSVSPDGRSVAYSHARVVFVTDLGTDTRREVVVDAWAPAWSGDGTRIAFLVAAAGEDPSRKSHIEVIDRDGKNRRRVTQRSARYWSLSWAPVPDPR